jgi:hypothetical protein
VIGAGALTVRFLLELAALAALGWWGATVHPAFSVALPLAAALLWAAFAAPKAKWPSPAGRLAVETLVFGGAAAALAAVGRPVLAAAFALVALVDGVAVRVYSADAPGFAPPANERQPPAA